MGNKIEKENKEYFRKGAVTLLDVLGWKGVWQRKTNAVQDLKHIIKGIEQRALEIVGEEKYRSAKDFKNLEVEVKSISDTIALITYGDCETTLRFQSVLSGLLIASALERGLFIRGATCYGELYNEDNIFVGPAIDEVASWYEAVNWIGVIVTPSALWSLNEPYSEYGMYNLYIEEIVSVKQGGTFKTLCVNWAYIWRHKKNTDTQLKQLFIENGPITPDIALKLSNSLQFYNKYKEKDFKANKKE